MKLLTREALLSFRRAPLLSVLSVTTIAFSLFTVGLFGLVAINLREALRGIGGAGRDRRLHFSRHAVRDDRHCHTGHHRISRSQGRELRE